MRRAQTNWHRGKLARLNTHTHAHTHTHTHTSKLLRRENWKKWSTRPCETSYELNGVLVSLSTYSRVSEI